MRLNARDVLAFAAEVAAYVAVASWSWRRTHPPITGPVGAGCAVLVMATWWGMLHAPRAPRHLPGPLEAALRAAWFAVAFLAAVSTLASPRP